jgi:hypothetical protein
MTRIWNLVVLTLLPLFSGCHQSGTWENDAKNWERAFGQEPPKGVEIVHSWLWRSPHFTLECEYFFQLRSNRAFAKQAIETGRLENMSVDPNSDQEEREQLLRFFHDKPSWFIPKPIERYEIWRGKPPAENFRLFLDQDDGSIFLTDFTV